MISTKKKVGIFVDSRKESGGAYQELLYTIDNFKKNNKNKNKFKFVIICTSKNLDLRLEKENLELYYFSMNTIERYICYLRNFGPLIRRLKKYYFFKNKFEKFLKGINVDLVYFTGTSQYSLYLENTKFIITTPDVMHREFFEFPEFADDGEFQRKDEIFSKSLPRALAVITNAAIIKENIIKFYGVLEKRVIILNHQPSKVIEDFDKPDIHIQSKIRKKLSLPNTYIFYPGMYLPHKNHKTIIDTIELLKEKYKKSYNVLFCGNDIGYLDNLKLYASLKKVGDQITFLNFVDDEVLPYLYLDASIVLMTHISGPTMLPPWEAFKMKVPVIHSSIKGISQILDDCVSYIDPLDKENIAKKIIQINNDPKLKSDLINKGHKKYNSIKKENEFNKIIEVIDNYYELKKLWEKI